MVVYADVAAFQRALKNEEIYTRSQFLYRVKWATIQNTGHYPNKENLKALLFAMYAGLLPVQHVCETCHQHFYLRYRSDRCMWEWYQDKLTCAECTKSLAKGTVLEGVYGKNWLNFFDAFCMWTFDYPPALTQREVGIDHKRLLQWEKVWHEGVEADLQTRLASSNIAAVPPQSANRTRGVKRPAAAKKGVKRPAGMKGFKRPAAAKFNAMKQKKTANGARFCARYRHVIEVDESHLNKAKAGHLTRSGRVQADQVWVWGATVPKQPDRFLFRVLDYAEDAYEGRPRGKKEILECFRLINIPKKTILVTDGWKATKAAVKAFKQEKRWGDDELCMRWSTIAPARLSMPMGSPPITSKIDGARSSAGCQRDPVA